MAKKKVSGEITKPNNPQFPEDLKQKIQTFQSEILQAKLQGQEISYLEEQLKQLALKLGEEVGLHQIPLELIDRDESQPRTVFPAVLIKERVESLRRFGQLTPVILIPHDNQRYRLFDGELRYRSAQKLNWHTLDAVLIPVEDSNEKFTVFENQVITSIHSQRLHDLDLANALVKLLCYRFANIEEVKERIPTILNTCLRRLERNNELAHIAEIRLTTPEKQIDWLDSLSFKRLEERQIFELLLELQLNPVSVNSNVLPLLKLTDDLIQAIQIDGFESSKARELNKVSSSRLNISPELAQEIRAKLIQKALSENLSLTQIKRLVGNIILDYSQQPVPKKKDKCLKLVDSLDISSISDVSTLKELKKLLNLKLKEVNLAIKTQ